MEERHKEIEGLKHLEAAAQCRRRSLIGTSATFYDERMREEKKHIPQHLQHEYNKITKERNQTKLNEEINKIKGKLRTLGYDHTNMATIEKYRRGTAERSKTRRRSTSRSKLYERAHEEKYDYKTGRRRSKSVMKQKATRKREEKKQKIMQERIRTELQAEAKRKQKVESLKKKAKNMVKAAHQNLQNPEPEEYQIEPQSPIQSKRMIDMNEIEEQETSSLPQQQQSSPIRKKEKSLPQQSSPIRKRPTTIRPSYRQNIAAAPTGRHQIIWKPNYAPSLPPEEQQMIYESTRAEAEQYRLRQSSSRLFGPDPLEEEENRKKAITLDKIYKQMQIEEVKDRFDIEDDDIPYTDDEEEEPVPVQELPQAYELPEKQQHDEEETYNEKIIPNFQPATEPTKPSKPNAFTTLLQQFHKKCAEADASYADAVARERQRYEHQLADLQEAFQQAMADL